MLDSEAIFPLRCAASPVIPPPPHITAPTQMAVEPLTEPPQLAPKTLDQVFRRRVLVTAVAVTMVNVFCMTSLTPLFPDVARDLGLGPDGLGLLMGISPLVSVLFQLP